MHDRETMVYLIDDDLRIHQALTDLFCSAGRALKAFLHPDEFFAFKQLDVPACLLLDLQSPGTTRVKVQARLSAGRMPPTIFLRGEGDIPSTVKAMKAGAVEFLESRSMRRIFLPQSTLRSSRTSLPHGGAGATAATMCYRRLTPKGTRSSSLRGIRSPE